MVGELTMKLFFIIGMRRSGTSILRSLLMNHPEINDIEFEPHPLWNAVDLSHFPRFELLPYVKETISEFKGKGSGEKWHGAKFALNPGVKAMEWVWLPQVFPEAKFVFILRDRGDTYKSYYKEDCDKLRGYIPERIYNPFFDFIVNTFHHSQSVKISFEGLVKNADVELEKACDLLEIKRLVGAYKFMETPNNWSNKEK